MIAYFIQTVSTFTFFLEQKNKVKSVFLLYCFHLTLTNKIEPITMRLKTLRKERPAFENEGNGMIFP